MKRALRASKLVNRIQAEKTEATLARVRRFILMYAGQYTSNHQADHGTSYDSKMSAQDIEKFIF